MAGLIRVHEDPFDLSRPAVHSWAGPIIDWLRREYPDGFSRPHQARLNGRPMPVEDYDTPLRAGDVLDLVILPGAPVAAAFAAINWAQIAAGIAVSLAVSYAANALFGSKPPRPGTAGTSGAGRAAASVGVPTNEARIGQAIPVQYGRVRSVPDLATSPYRRFESDDEYVRGILCLGMGEHTVHEVYLGDTAFSALGSAASYWVYRPTDHGQTLGVIEAALGIYEDAVTNIEVDALELQRDGVAQSYGPFAACRSGCAVRRVEIDIELPQGLYQLDGTGASTSEDVDLTILIERIDDDGTVLGTVSSNNEEIEHNTRDHRRKTFAYDVSPPGRVQVTVTRTDDPFDDPRLGIDLAYWTGMRGVHPVSGPGYGPVTLIAWQLRSTNGVSAAASDRISVDATRRLGGVDTSNPAPIIRDIWTDSTYGAGRAEAELDGDALDALELAAAAANGYNHRITGQRTVWDAIRAAARPVDWYPVPLGGLVSFAQDAATETVSAAFNSANMHDVSVLMRWDEQGATDGVEVAYIDPATGATQYALHPATSANPDEVLLEGCTDDDTAAAAAEGLWLRNRYRRQWITWTTELEGALLAIGSRVSLTHPLIGTAVGAIIQSVRPVDEHRHEVTAWRYDARQYVA